LVVNQLRLDLAAGRRARDEGLDAAALHNAAWLSKAIDHLRYFASRMPTFTMEDFRAHCSSFTFPSPESHHAWGALTQIARKRGVILFTGQYTPAKSKKTHAHPVKVWRAA
jgi:hypothetical protein